MRILAIIVSVFLVSWSGLSNAGSLVNGEWTITKCGDKPATPSVNDKDIDSYNESVKAINNWQAQANKYYGCVVSEANADNAAIAQKANQEQAGYKQAFEAIAASLEAAKKKVDK